MCRALEHRGPDDEHVHAEPGLAMGVRRLAIVDIDGGRQPLCNERGNVWVAFNGELFEHEKLLDELTLRGHRLSTRCDTEAWAHLYEERGERLWGSLRGQFATAVWDRASATLLLGRDRLGICPLFYARQDGWLLWASEIKALLASGLISARPDVRGINHLFCFCSSAPRRTCFEGISSLPPGHYLKVSRGRIQLNQYWDLDFPDRGCGPDGADVDGLVDNLEDHLRNAVRRRLRGDVPVVSYLSGGVDSTLVLALARQESGHPVPSFTIALTGSPRDEQKRARESARLFESELTTLTMTGRDIADAFPRLIMAAEGPVVDTSSACMIKLASEVHDQGYKVALTGEGADEAMAGYPWYYLQKLRPAAAAVLRWLPSVLGGRPLLLSRRNGQTRRAPRDGFGGVRTTQQDYVEVVARCREALFTDQMWEQLDGVSPFDELCIPEDRMRRWHPLNQAIYVDYRTFLPGLLLSAKGDRAAMSSSVETRPPFLDEDVVDFCASLPPQFKMRRLTEKWLLRKVAERVLPAHVAWRRKLGFHTEFSDTFFAPDRPAWVDQLLSEASLRATGYFDPVAVQRQRSRLTRSTRRVLPRFSFDLGLTAVVATQLWHHTFCGGQLADLPSWVPPASSAGHDAGIEPRRKD
jgi:asparagine synthase (glutamine-hydrolysing)